MDGRNLIIIILCFLVAGCSSPLLDSKSELQALNNMNRAAELENLLEYRQAAQEYAIVAERYPSTSYYQAAVWKAALLNIHPANSEIDYSAALYWFKAYLELPLSQVEKECAQLHVAMLEHINRLQAEIPPLNAENERLVEVTQQQSGDITTSTQRLRELEAELAQARDELKKMKDVDVQMHRSRVNVNGNSLLNKEGGTQHLSRHNDLPKRQDFYPYTIQVGSSINKEESIRAATKLRNKGDTGFVSHANIPGKGDWYRIFVGFYRTFEEAQKAAYDLKKHEDFHAFVVKMPFTIQIGIFSNDEELKKMEGNLRSKGYLGYSVPDRLYNKKIRLLVGAFRTEKEAAIFARELQKKGFNPKVVQR
jgi:hypothetical protein